MGCLHSKPFGCDATGDNQQPYSPGWQQFKPGNVDEGQFSVESTCGSNTANSSVSIQLLDSLQLEADEQFVRQHDVNGSTFTVTGAVPVKVIGQQQLHQHMQHLCRISNSSNGLEEKRVDFQTCELEDMMADVSRLAYLRGGGNSYVFCGQWHSTTVALKFFSKPASTVQTSTDFNEALLGQELSHPNLVQCYETRCARVSKALMKQVTEGCMPIRLNQSSELFGAVESASPATPNETPGPTAANTASSGGGAPPAGMPFVSGDGFGAPDATAHVAAGPNSAPITWRELLRLLQVQPGDYLTLVIMQFCNMGDLGSAVSRGVFKSLGVAVPEGMRRLRYKALLRTAREVAQALDYLHRHDVVHGNLTPSSIVLHGSRKDQRGFIAQLVRCSHSRMVEGSRHKSTSPKGSLEYLAPELFGGQLSKASDVYAFGMLLWEMVAGERPYRDLHKGRIVMGIKTGMLRPIWPNQPELVGCNAALQELFERCMSQDPSARPAASEIVPELISIELELGADWAAQCC